MAGLRGDVSVEEREERMMGFRDRLAESQPQAEGLPHKGYYGGRNR